ncbi:MAG: hypothetical protein H7A25_17570 [Leptospiraceae bacterium]|nr:hypothetical protein [Leptospiraceae bacterium]MCP5501716.1 hypothetical protein [Leptospiraceae bacterium]
MLILTTFQNPFIFLIDIIFLVSISSIVSWYFFFYQKKEIFGGFLGGTIIASFGAVLILLTQSPIRDFVMWLMSPKIGTTQLSRVNIIVATLGAFLALFILEKIGKARSKRE